MVDTNQQREGWEKEFFKEFEEPYFYYVSLPEYSKEKGMRSKGENIEWLKAFIKETLATERERVLEEVERGMENIMSDEPGDSTYSIFNVIKRTKDLITSLKSKHD